MSESTRKQAVAEDPAGQAEGNKPAEIAIVDERTIRDKIYIVRGVKVMLDFELAEIYGYTTSRFNEQVTNNIDKFDADDFCFYLTPEDSKTFRV